MLWKHYVYRRGDAVHDLWDGLFHNRPINFLYIAGRGFDIRVKAVLSQFLDNIRLSGHTIEKAELLLVGFDRYELSEDLAELTESNAKDLESLFQEVGEVTNVTISESSDGEDDLSASTALRITIREVLAKITDQTDIILDVSSLPRVAYIGLLTSILSKLVPNNNGGRDLYANGVNFQVLVAEDSNLDSQIKSEDPDNDLVLIPGFSSAMHAESFQDWPLVWFPILGENRVKQFEKIAISAGIPDTAEICPIVPHPSADPRRSDRLIVEYKLALFDALKTPTSNILHAHESHPFEAYRQLLEAMERYRDSLMILGGCRLVVTPLASKLISIGAGLACFEMQPSNQDENYGVAIPYAEPRRYVASLQNLKDSDPELTSLLLTGEAYMS